MSPPRPRQITSRYARAHAGRRSGPPDPVPWASCTLSMRTSRHAGTTMMIPDSASPNTADDARGCRAANAKQRLLAVAAFPSRRGDHAGEQRRDDHARETEEKEQHL